MPALQHEDRCEIFVVTVFVGKRYVVTVTHFKRMMAYVKTLIGWRVC